MSAKLSGYDKFIAEQMAIWFLVVFGGLFSALALEWVGNGGLLN